MVTSLETLQNFKLWKDFIFHSHNSVQKPLAAGAWDPDQWCGKGVAYVSER